MKTQTLNAEQGSQFTRKNLGFPVPRRISDLVNEDTQERNAEAENEEGIREEEKEIKSG